ncbi:MAG TPA: arginine--tRNA ligase [Acidobacteriaceae bacterium]|nr:arginine--tRNA ligase [Acidobacteriaceae bacterium]
MYLEQQKRLEARLRAILERKYDVVPEKIALEQPPNLAFGEFASPVAFDLARRLKKAPRKIAEEVIAELTPLEGFQSFEVAGAGYINAKLNRATALGSIARGEELAAPAETGSHVLVEHTSINPNKAAHIGHLRNAILGDTFVRLLRAAGERVDVQNYIDNTGVQVADIVVALMHLEGYDLAGVARLVADLAARGERLDYFCWNLYARVSEWYESAAELKDERKEIRLRTLHELEQGGNDAAAVAELISTAVLRRHLETMERLGIEYDFLPRESEILHLKFWDLAFEQLRAKGVLYLETEGKNRGCWVMPRAGAGRPDEAGDAASDPAGPDEDAKIIVRSNGTVTYVGKDIAYHLWKFGVLGRDFGYAPFYRYGDREAWISTEHGVADHPHFGGAAAIYNVIDSRQSDPQANVVEALRGLGFSEAAAHYTHFSYEMVALTPRCALELGYAVTEEDRQRPYIEVSGRKGFGVKADDLIDRMIAAAQEEVDSRHPARSPQERERIAQEIAIGALRYFMLKYTRNSVIAFDFAEALSFEGETGPYVQYAVVRARNIFRKAGVEPEAALASLETAPLAEPALLHGEQGDEIWEVWLAASKLSLVLEQCIATTEPAYLAKHTFQLAQLFNNFYHRHHILTEQDPERKRLLLATAAVVERSLVRGLDWLGIAAPERM